MLAIFKTGGKQYSAKAGQILKVEKLNGLKGDKVSFTDVLAISDEKTNNLVSQFLKMLLLRQKLWIKLEIKKLLFLKKEKDKITD